MATGSLPMGKLIVMCFEYGLRTQHDLWQNTIRYSQLASTCHNHCQFYSHISSYHLSNSLSSALHFQFAAHSQILRLLAPSIDWRADPLRHLSSASVRAVLHYLYTESLPVGLSLAVAGELRASMGELPELAPLAELCGRYVTNAALRDGQCWWGQNDLRRRRALKPQ